MKKPFGGSRPGLYTPKKRTKARFKPYSEDADFESSASSLALFGIDLHRQSIGLEQFDYWITRPGQPSEITTLIAVRKLLLELWMNWGKQ